MTERQSMAVDIACVGFGPAMAGFLTTLSRRLAAADRPLLESAASPGMALQVVCYERADDPGFGVSGVVTRARGIRAAFPDLDASQIPMAAPVKREKVLYLLDPIGASRRSAALRAADAAIRAARFAFRYEEHAVELPYVPDELETLERQLSDTYYCNFSVFQSVPDHWAVRQLFPTVPIHRLNRPPSRLSLIHI